MKKSSFHYTNLKNNGVIVIPRFSTVYGSVRTSFGDLGEKFTYIEITNEIAELQEFNTNLEICLPHSTPELDGGGFLGLFYNLKKFISRPF